MSFTNPLFLWAMFSVSIPVIIHLINFRRYKTLYFSNTLFLEDIKKETQKRTKLKHILILIARILTIAMLVFAFAGPFVPNKKIGTDSKHSEINIIYIDNSFSMEAEGARGQIFEQAKQIAKQIAFNSSTGMEYLIITNDMLPEQQNIISRDLFIQYVDKTNITSNSIELDNVVLKANTITPNDKNANLYIISDMQKTFVDEIHTKVNHNINPIFIPVKSVNQNNLYIDTCYFETPIHKLGQQEILNVRIVNSSDEDYFEIPIQLYINDSLKVIASFNIEAGQSNEINLEYVNTFSGDLRGRLEIVDYPVTYDNYIYFNYSISDLTNVLIINADDANRYLEALFNSDPENFKLSQIKLGNQQSTTFENYDIIILNNVSEISTGLTADLQNFVSNGGSLVFIPSADINYSSCNSFLSSFNAGRFEQGKNTNSRIYSIEYDHELFRKVFQRQEKQVDLPSMGLIHSYNIFNSSTYSRVLSIESSNPVLAAGNYNNGKLYIFSSPLTDINSDFVKSPLFVPLFFNIALNSQINNSLYTILEDGANINTISNIDVNESDIFRIINGVDIDIITNFRSIGRVLQVKIPYAIKNAGGYKLMKEEQFITMLSFNYNRKESDLKYLENNDLKQYLELNFDNRAKIIDAGTNSIEASLMKFSEEKQLWQIFLLLALFFILCEIIFVRFLK